MVNRNSLLLEPHEDALHNLKMSKNKAKRTYNILVWAVGISLLLTGGLFWLQYALWGEVCVIITVILFICALVALQHKKRTELQYKNQPGEITM